VLLKSEKANEQIILADLGRLQTIVEEQESIRKES